jgi:hypothetical protein
LRGASGLPQIQADVLSYGANPSTRRLTEIEEAVLIT